MTLGVALVTGAARGIGRAIALQLAKDGFNIALNDIGHQDELATLRDEIKALGRDSIECFADVSKEAEVKSMVDQTVEKLGSLDVMVANAGISFTKFLIDCTLEDWDKIFDVNAKGVFLCYKYAALAMIQQGRGGRIIGAASLAGKQGFPRASFYSATKFAVRGLTHSLALELRPYGITVNAYAPAQDYHERHSKGVDPLKFGSAVGNPEDVANLVSYLASKDTNFLSGKFSCLT
ncbi:3-oxoacyl-[acyl-carrier-protein] reductase FabG [Leucoagaricus sp. SymC.cos]|nr:3-oxoacyl-[acyl-carrier-protein] reductase FabG [Leucoagaricus sp. SymC.cos]